MTNEKVIAKKSDWETCEMPKACKEFKLNRKFTSDEIKNLKYGNIPQEMEDKWFWYMEGNTLYAHRSWTGFCIYIMEIDEVTGIHNVTVNRDKNQYTCKSIKEDEQTLNHLLDWWTKPSYDYYGEWLDETVANMQKAQGASAERLEERAGNGCISLYQGDITKIDCECIVNAAKNSLLGGGGVDGAIHKAAGPKLLEECKTLNGCETGKAKITKGYNLPARYIIHTVGPIYSGKSSDAKLLASCYKSSLDLAKTQCIRSIAFPLISAGAYGYPLKEAMKIAARTSMDWIEANKEYEIHIIFCCFERKTYDLFYEVIDSIEDAVH